MNGIDDEIEDDGDLGDAAQDDESTPVRIRAKRNGPRPKVLARRSLKLAVLADRPEYRHGEYADIERPQTRGECRGGPRPCPWVGCRHHLYIDVNPSNGSMRVAFPDREPWELVESCALDVAERGPITLDDVGAIMNLTRERIRQLEANGLAKLKDERSHELH